MGTEWVIWGYFVVAMFLSALIAKALGASIVFAVSLLWLNTFEGTLGLATGAFILYVAAVVLAAFRD